VVFVELPNRGSSFEKMDVFGTIEAVKAVSDLYCPVAGEVVAVNEALEEDPSLVNSDPYGAGWMVKLRVSDAADLDGLLSADAYAEHIDWRTAGSRHVGRGAPHQDRRAGRLRRAPPGARRGRDRPDARGARLRLARRGDLRHGPGLHPAGPAARPA